MSEELVPTPPANTATISPDLWEQAAKLERLIRLTKRRQVEELDALKGELQTLKRSIQHASQIRS